MLGVTVSADDLQTGARLFFAGDGYGVATPLVAAERL